MTIGDTLEVHPIDLLQGRDELADSAFSLFAPLNFDINDSVDSSMAVNRIDKHERPKGLVAGKLRKMGLQVRPAASTRSHDLLINGRTRVTLRVAYPGLRRHRVTVGGRSYRYHYETWHFNFHHHGRLEDQYTDFFICIAINPKRGEKDRIFVIPWRNVTGKTFSLHSGKSNYRGRYAPFLNAWDAISEAAGGPGKSLLKVA